MQVNNNVHTEEGCGIDSHVSIFWPDVSVCPETLLVVFERPGVKNTTAVAWLIPFS